MEGRRLTHALKSLEDPQIFTQAWYSCNQLIDQALADVAGGGVEQGGGAAGGSSSSSGGGSGLLSAQAALKLCLAGGWVGWAVEGHGFLRANGSVRDS